MAAARRSTSSSKSPARRPTRRRELRGDAPAEVLEGVAALVPRREDGRAEALHVAVLVAGDRPDVVGGGHARGPVRSRAAHDQDHPQPR